MKIKIGAIMTESATACHYLYRASVYSDYIPLATQVTSLLKIFLKCVMDLTGYQPTENERIFTDLTNHSYGRYLLLVFFPVGGIALVVLHEYVTAEDTKPFGTNYKIYWENGAHPYRLEAERFNVEYREPYKVPHGQGEDVYSTPSYSPQVETPVLRGSHVRFESRIEMESPYYGKEEMPERNEKESADSSYSTSPFSPPMTDISMTSPFSIEEEEPVEPNSRLQHIEMDLAYFDLPLSTPATGRSNFNSNVKFASNPGPTKSREQESMPYPFATPLREVVRRETDAHSPTRRKLFGEDAESGSDDEGTISLNSTDLLSSPAKVSVQTVNSSTTFLGDSPSSVKRELVIEPDGNRKTHVGCFKGDLFAPEKGTNLFAHELEHSPGRVSNPYNRGFVAPKSDAALSVGESPTVVRQSLKAGLTQVKKHITTLNEMGKDYSQAREKMQDTTSPSQKDRYTQQTEAYEDIANGLRRTYAKFDGCREEALSMGDSELTNIVHEIQTTREQTGY